MSMAVVSGGGRPSVGGYKLKSGIRVPSVTTIIGRWKEAGGLIRWAYKCGLEGIDIDKARDDAAAAGTAMHEMIECDIHGREWEPPPHLPAEDLKKARQAFAAYRDWVVGVRLQVTETEVPLVSEQHRYGGTPDFIGIAGGKRVLGDWKSSGKIYAEYIVQVGAYRQLWRENRGEDLEGCHMLRFGKEHGTFTHLYLPPDVLELGWRQFQLFRQAYENDKQLKKAAGA